MFTNSVLAFVLGVFGCLAAFFPRLVYTFKSHNNSEIKTDPVVKGAVQLLGLVLLAFAFHYLSPILNGHP